MAHKRQTEAEAIAEAEAFIQMSREQRAAWAMELLEEVRGLVINPASDFEAQPVNWLWPGRIARGHLTLLAGDSSSGKSLVALDLAARVSRGSGWPDDPQQRQEPGNVPGNVLVLTAHNDPAAIGRPRLERAGADLSRVFFATGVERPVGRGYAWKRQVHLPDDFMSLLKAISSLRPLPLVVLDPAWAFCSRGRGRSRLAGPAQLAELAELAALLQVAIVCVTDLRRDGPYGYRAGGDRALLAAAPTAWGLVREPRQPHKRFMLPLKSNLGPEQQQGLAFCIDDGRVEWESEPATISGAALLAAERSRHEPMAAEAWLTAFLADGPQPATEVFRQGGECGYSPKTLRRAKDSVGVKADKWGFNGDTHWKWTLDRAETNGVHEISGIFDSGEASSSDSGVFCEDAETPGGASSTADSGHLRANSADLSKM